MTGLVVSQKENLKPCVSSYDGELSQALQSVSISKSDNEYLSKNLKYAMFIVGIRESGMPTQIEFDFLKNFIRKNYGGNRVDEIKIAFDMAIAGKLDLGKDGAKCYENFSCEYFGRIMTAYRSWAVEEYKFIESKQTPVALLEPPKQTAEETIEFWFTQWKESKTKNYLLFSGFIQVYDLIREELEFTKEQKVAMVAKAKFDLLASANGTHEEKLMQKLIQNKDYVTTICKKLAVSIYFDKLIAIDGR